MRGEETEGLTPIVDNNTRVLILGSFPGADSLREKKYYANKRNGFWKIMSLILIANISPHNQRKIARYKIGLWDVIKSCDRIGSYDSKITEPVINDIPSFVKDHPKIKAIFLNGGKAAPR